VFEDLDIDGMQQNGNRVINKGIADVAWGMLLNFSQYKAPDTGRGYLKVNSKRTTQDCSGCGEIVPKDLSVRVRYCPRCGLKIGRDLNAALNVLSRGLARIGNQSVEAPAL
jgi:putative transposase